MMDQIEGDDMFKCYVELKKYATGQDMSLAALPTDSFTLADGTRAGAAAVVHQVLELDGSVQPLG
jgi:hypothetical protein